jgi:hypothetical protein
MLWGDILKKRERVGFNIDYHFWAAGFVSLLGLNSNFLECGGPEAEPWCSKVIYGATPGSAP